MRKTYDYVFKIILVGDSGVGKTNIMCRFAPDDMNIIGVVFKIRALELDGQIVKLQIWDTAGQERFKTITTAYYRGAMGIMLVYDICNANSFDSISGYHKHLKEHASRGVEIMLLGNNCHMKVKRQVNKETGERFAAEHGMKFMEVSADESVNIEEAFFTLARQILHKIEAATSSDECVQEDGSDEFRPGNACVVQ